MARRPSATMTAVPSWVELTMVVREEQTVPNHEYGDGEDDEDIVTTEPAQTIEITTKAKVQRGFVRYFMSRRDNQSGSELHFTNGHVMIVQEGLADIGNMLPGFVPVHCSGAPSEVQVNPENVRFLHGHVPALGGTEASGSRLTFPNGNKLEVLDSYDELAARFGVN